MGFSHLHGMPAWHVYIFNFNIHLVFFFSFEIDPPFSFLPGRLCIFGHGCLATTLSSETMTEKELRLGGTHASILRQDKAGLGTRKGSHR